MKFRVVAPIGLLANMVGLSPMVLIVVSGLGLMVAMAFGGQAAGAVGAGIMAIGLVYAVSAFLVYFPLCGLFVGLVLIEQRVRGFTSLTGIFFSAVLVATPILVAPLFLLPDLPILGIILFAVTTSTFLISFFLERRKKGSVRRLEDYQRV